MGKDMRKKTPRTKIQNPVHYDPKVDVLYIAMREGRESDMVEVAPGVQVELDNRGQVIGIEFLNASRFLKSVLKPLERRLAIAA